jgi:hypothetical protein
MALFCQNMLEIAAELTLTDVGYAEWRKEFQETQGAPGRQAASTATTHGQHAARGTPHLGRRKQ